MFGKTDTEKLVQVIRFSRVFNEELIMYFRIKQ